MPMIRTNAWPLLAALALAGCTTLPPQADAEAALHSVQATVKTALPKAELRQARSEDDQAAIDRHVAGLLAQPLDVDAAVQLALLNHRGVQAALAELGIAAADVLQVSRLPNPGFRFARIRGGEEIELERGLHWSLARLLLLPQRVQAEARRAEAVQAMVATEVLSLAAEARRAWIGAVAAEETLRYALKVQQAAQAGAELARRLEQVGNFNKLARAREQGFYADAALGVARAEQQRRAARERLARALGLWGAQLEIGLPERLPDLPAALAERPEIEREAIAQRLDLRAALAGAQQLARDLGIAEAGRFSGALEIGHERSSSNEGHRSRTWEIALELPVFDFGDARVARARAQVEQARHRAAAAAVNARSEVREAYGNWRLAWDIARHHREELVPLRQRIAEEQLLRYNGMLIGVFELLADARAQVMAVNAAIEALRDFWLADAELQVALIGKPSLPAAGGPAMSAGTAAAPAGH